MAEIPGFNRVLKNGVFERPRIVGTNAPMEGVTYCIHLIICIQLC